MTKSLAVRWQSSCPTTEDRRFVSRLRGEAYHAAAVSHPGIVGVLDYGEATTADGAGPTPYLVMELVDGEPLSALLGARAASAWSEPWRLSGRRPWHLGAAHRAGLVHRDVKPGNLLVRADGAVKVIDFGIARSPGDPAAGQADAASGTVAYLSPEQAVGQPAVPASDVYGLGVVAYECLAGRRRFTGEHPIAVALAHLLQAPPPLPDDVPVGVRALVAQAMAEQPGCGRPMRRCLAGNCWRSAGA